MKVYKLTNKYCETRNNTLFEIGKPVKATGTGKDLCSDGWIHFYQDPIIAVIMNPIHANFNPPRLFEAEAVGELLLEPLKGGCKELTLIKELELPVVTMTNKISFGIYCALKVYKDPKFVLWADKWLSGTNRNSAAANAAANDAAGGDAEEEVAAGEDAAEGETPAAEAASTEADTAKAE